jgi:hypothetical protein
MLVVRGTALGTLGMLFDGATVTAGGVGVSMFEEGPLAADGSNIRAKELSCSS